MCITTPHQSVESAHQPFLTDASLFALGPQGGVHFDALELHSSSHSVLGKSPGFSSHNGSGSILQPMGPSQHVDFMGRRGGATSSG
eukprot:2495719-Prymnesium_polylepis.1